MVTVTQYIPFPVLGVLLFLVVRWILSVSLATQPPLIVSIGLFLLCCFIGHKIWPLYLTRKYRRKATMNEMLSNIQQLHGEIKRNKR